MKRHPRKLRASKQAKSPLLLRVPVTIQAAAQAEGKPAGPGRFDAVAYSGGLLPGYTAGLDLPIVVDLKGLAPIRNIVANLDHEKKKRVGNVTEFTNDGRTISVAGKLSASTPHRDEVANSAADGFEWEMSIETDITKIEPLRAGKTAVVNGQTFTGPIYIARKTAFTGVAFVSNGADEGNRVQIAATAAKKGTDMEFENWVAEQGFEANTLTDAQRTALQAGYKASKQTPMSEPDGGILGGKVAEQKRLQAIRQLANAAFDESPNEGERIEAMAQQAIENSEDSKDFELRLLRAMRPTAKARATSSREGADAGVIEAALALSCGLQKPESHYSEQTLDAAHKKYKRGLGLGEFLLTAARQNGGYNELSTANVEAVLEAAFPPRGHRHLQAASQFSTLPTPGILSNVANKLLKDHFMAVEQEWRKVSAITPVRDFKTITSYSLTGDFEYREVGPTGELEHAKPGEQEYTNRAKTFGRMLGIARQDIVNDDLNAFRNVPKHLGRGGALKLNDVFWREWLDNASFYTTARNNLDEGADTAFSADALILADTLFRLQTDPDGKPLGSAPKKLVVPPAYRIAALRLMNSQHNATASDAGTDNPFAGMFDVVSSVYMANTTYTGASAKKWYLTADPNDLPVIETVFLNGIEMPTIESAEADFDQLGILFRGVHDFGCAKQEYRGGVAMKGEV